MNRRIQETVNEYYTGKVKEFGASPKGVDWNSLESQYLRFEKLLFCNEVGQTGTMLDFGCGTGALLGYLKLKNLPFKYYGYDLSPEMIEVASSLYVDGNFATELSSEGKYDYVVGSGIFNVKLNISIESWEEYMFSTIDEFNFLSDKYFAFNVLSLYSDPEKRRGDLYYADPLKLFDHCKKKYSRFVSLIHDYNLYEFTIVVKK